MTGPKTGPTTKTAIRVAIGPGDDPVALVRAAAGESVLMLINPALDPLELASALAVVGPLAVERAPGGRVNALLAAADADPADVEVAALYLEEARSVTGQLVEVTARARVHGPSRSIT